MQDFAIFSQDEWDKLRPAGLHELTTKHCVRVERGDVPWLTGSKPPVCFHPVMHYEHGVTNREPVAGAKKSAPSGLRWQLIDEAEGHVDLKDAKDSHGNGLVDEKDYVKLQEGLVERATSVRETVAQTAATISFTEEEWDTFDVVTGLRWKNQGKKEPKSGVELPSALVIQQNYIESSALVRALRESTQSKDGKSIVKPEELEPITPELASRARENDGGEICSYHYIKVPKLTEDDDSDGTCSQPPKWRTFSSTLCARWIALTCAGRTSWFAVP